MKKGKTILLILIICLVTAKCADPSDQKSKFEQENQKIARLYQPIYEKGLRDDFCVKAGENKKAEQTLLLVQSDGDVVRCDLSAVDGEIEIYCYILSFEEGVPVTDESYRFVCYVWEYSDNGYLFLEKYRPKDLDGVPMNMAIRVKPLDEKCRQYNRKYVESIGYNSNNLFITDWSEEDYGNLDCAFSHELTVCQLEDGSFQYVSNRVLLESADVFCPEWYRERLTEQE